MHVSVASADVYKVTVDRDAAAQWLGGIGQRNGERCKRRKIKRENRGQVGNDPRGPAVGRDENLLRSEAAKSQIVGVYGVLGRWRTPGADGGCGHNIDGRGSSHDGAGA